jgi:hypothetical protein
MEQQTSPDEHITTLTISQPEYSSVIEQFKNDIYVHIATMSFVQTARHLAALRSTNTSPESIRTINEVSHEIERLIRSSADRLNTQAATSGIFLTDVYLYNFGSILNYAMQLSEELPLTQSLISAIGIQFQDSDKDGLLHLAVKASNAPLVLWLIEQAHAQLPVDNNFVNMQNDQKETPLDTAYGIKNRPTHPRNIDAIIDILQRNGGVRNPSRPLQWTDIDMTWSEQQAPQTAFDVNSID